MKQTETQNLDCTEFELMAIDDAMARVLWTRQFFTVQGMYIPTTTILLAETVKQSSSNQMRHLNVRYFFISDNIKKEEVKVTFCPMHDMLWDLITKPLQGTLFTQMRAKILNLPIS